MLEILFLFFFYGGGGNEICWVLCFIWKMWLIMIIKSYMYIYKLYNDKFGIFWVILLKVVIEWNIILYVW